MDNIITTITGVATAVIDAVAKGAQSLADVFFTKASEGGAINGLSGLGYFVAISLGVGLVGLAIRFVTRFIKSR